MIGTILRLKKIKLPIRMCRVTSAISRNPYLVQIVSTMFKIQYILIMDHHPTLNMQELQDILYIAYKIDVEGARTRLLIKLCKKNFKKKFM